MQLHGNEEMKILLVFPRALNALPFHLLYKAPPNTKKIQDEAAAFD